MVTQLDLEIPADVTALLAEFGWDATFIVRSKTYDEDTGLTSFGSEPNVVWKCTPPWPYGQSFRKGDAAIDGQAKIYIAAEGLTFEPRAGMQVVIDGRTWMVTGTDRIRSGELTAAWGMDVER